MIPDCMEMVEQDDVGESIQVLETLVKGGEDFDSAGSAGIAGGLDRHGFQFAEGAVNYSD
jgi:hypothetical protein